MTVEAPMDRLMDRVTLDENGCWLVPTRQSHGYAQIMVSRKNIGAHRFAYEHFRGPIPDGLGLDHLCRVRHCVNPWHLEPVTQRENLLRGDTIPARHVALTHCPAGHEYNEENTYVWKGSRHCRQCMRNRDRVARPWRFRHLEGGDEGV